MDVVDLGHAGDRERRLHHLVHGDASRNSFPENIPGVAEERQGFENQDGGDRKGGGVIDPAGSRMEQQDGARDQQRSGDGEVAREMYHHAAEVQIPDAPRYRASTDRFTARSPRVGAAAAKSHTASTGPANEPPTSNA